MAELGQQLVSVPRRALGKARRVAQGLKPLRLLATEVATQQLGGMEIDLADAKRIANGAQSADAVLIGAAESAHLGGGCDSDFNGDVLDLLTACEEQGIFTVLLVETADDLDTPVAAVVTHFAVTDYSTTAQNSASATSLAQVTRDFAGTQRTITLDSMEGPAERSGKPSVANLRKSIRQVLR